MPSASKYSATSYYKLDDVRDGPIEELIEFVTEEPSQYGVDGKQLVLTFRSGRKLSLNGSNTYVLRVDIDDDYDRWPGHRVELFKGEVKVRGSMQAALRSRVLGGETTPAPERRSTPEAPAAKPKPDAKAGGGRPAMDDEIPF
jgi:hypothetical protein